MEKKKHLQLKEQDDKVGQKSVSRQSRGITAWVSPTLKLNTKWDISLKLCPFFET